MNPIDIDIISIDPKFIPTYESEQAAGADLRANISEPVTLIPGERKLIDTGIKIQLPVGKEAQIRPRSGLANKHGLTVLNSPGTIDADYRGPVMVNLINLGELAFTIYPEDRIAQMVITDCYQGRFNPVEQLTETKRGEGGHGHTGMK